MAEKADQQTLFVDISELAHRDSKTGIQRVVRGIVNALLAHGAYGYRVEFVHAVLDKPYRYAHNYVGRLQGNSPAEIVEAIAEPRAGDIFLGVDFQSIVVPLQRAFLQRIQANGTKVYFVIYDLLPIQFERHFPANSALVHKVWLNTVAQSGGAICISRAVAMELEGWLQVNQPMRRAPFKIGWFHLGADIEASQPSRGLPANATVILQALARRPTFLLVGTVEPRKGHAQVLAAFRKIWQQEIDVNLVVVGKKGWMVEAVAADMSSCSKNGKRLIWLAGASDEFLEKIYAASTCLIAASEGEGFGLPLIEAARRRVPIIARDIPVFREVAGNFAHYFSGLDPAALANAVTVWLALYKSGRHPVSIGMPTWTWRQSTSQLLDVAVNSNWPMQWVSSRRFCCAGSDDRLQTQVGRKRGNLIETTGVAGIILFGPYVSLPSDVYQIRLYGHLGRLGALVLRIKLTAQFGAVLLLEHNLVDSHSDELIADITLDIPEAIEEFEVSLSVTTETVMHIDRLEIVSHESLNVGERNKYASSLKEQIVGDNFSPVRQPAQTHTADLRKILMENGEEFVDAAFAALLRRRPDSTGGRAYLRALRNGTSKLQILYELSMSEECTRVGGAILGLADECAKVGIGEKSEPAEPVLPQELATISRAEQLLAIEDNNKLVELAYWILFKRSPDEGGLANYLEKLSSGMSKAQFLHELFTSPECRELGVELPGLRDVFMLEGLDVDPIREVEPNPEVIELPSATSLDELLSCHGGTFVALVFSTLLKRVPDSDEYQQRQNQLDIGLAKIQILAEIATTAEAILVGVDLPGLKVAIRQYRFSRIPILGNFLRYFLATEGDGAVDRRGRATEQRLFTFEADVARGLEGFERTMGNLAELDQNNRASAQELQERITSLERSVSRLRQLIQQSTQAQAEAATSIAGASNHSNRLALDLRAEEIARDLKHQR